MTQHWRPRPELRLSLEVQQSPRPKSVSPLKHEVRELVRRGMQPASKDLSNLFRYMADHIQDVRLEGGMRLADASDFIEWLRELAREAKG